MTAHHEINGSQQKQAERELGLTVGNQIGATIFMKFGDHPSISITDDLVKGNVGVDPGGDDHFYLYFVFVVVA